MITLVQPKGVSSWGERGLGYVHAPDGRDKNFSVGRFAAKRPPRRRLPAKLLYDQDVWWGDQGSTSECVSYGTHHALLDGGYIAMMRNVLPDTNDLTRFYKEAQKIDPWPGEDYDGTSVRAGVKTALAQGWIAGYLWCHDIASVRYALTEIGLVIVGTDWYRGMSQPDQNGVITVSGFAEGGHCYVLNGFIRTTDGNHWYRGKNSWGRSWGDHGNFWIRERELYKLLNPYAEFAVPVPNTRAIEFDFEAAA